MQDYANCLGHYGIESFFRDMACCIACDRVDRVDVYVTINLVDSFLLFIATDFYPVIGYPEKIERCQATCAISQR
jgi:hypothetical protein